MASLPASRGGEMKASDESAPVPPLSLVVEVVASRRSIPGPP